MSSQNNPSDLLYEAITTPKKKLAFFVGAGVSIDSGLKDFKGFSKQFLSGIGPANWANEDNKDIDLITERLRPEVLLQVVQQVYGKNSLEFYSSLDFEIPNPNHYFLALALLRGHCVFTTNVDTLIEKACENMGISCAPIFYEEHYKDFLKKHPVDFSSQLFKLHGSIEPNKAGLAKYESIRFTIDRVGLGLDENTGKTLSACLQERDFVFLGYSGNDHFSVHPELLRVDSNQKVYWFKFRSYPPSLEDTSNSCDFQNQRDNLLKEASKDLSSAKWEDISLRELLIKWEPHSYLIEGNSSSAINDILKKLASSNEAPEYLKLSSNLKSFQADILSLRCGQKFSPSWVENITDFKRHLCAATLMIRARNLTQANSELKYSEECAKDYIEKAEVERLRATTYSITRRVGKEKFSKDDLYKAMEKFQMQGDLVAMIEAHLELANIIRIERNFSAALDELDKIENELVGIKPELQIQKKAYDWPRLMAHLLFLRGLVYGLGRKGIFKDKITGIEYCDKAADFASRAGDVARKAAILNARGLIISQLAERTSSILQEAEDSLNEALALHARLRDPRSCFQPSRNLLLVHRLRLLNSKSKVCSHWLNEAWEEANRAQDYLNQVETGIFEPIRDQIELDFRKAQFLGLKRDANKADLEFKKVLNYWEEKNDLHQQARIWQELLSLAEDQKEIQNCLSHLLNIIESLFQSNENEDTYRNDLLRLENIMDMLIDAYDKAYEIKDQEHLNRIKILALRGKEISELVGDSSLICSFSVYS
ncbi:SIR2 family protein [Methanosarcina sp. Mfa9]|uniref:SIR2 family protein n=1 Tax=Methanosarcina sp. Mfa9 TaxID=3439063 RepID=UPI003F86285C